MSILAVDTTFWVASHANAEAYRMLGLILVTGTGFYFIATRNVDKPES